MNKKIVFMGTPNISGKILKYLYQNGCEIETVYTQPPISSHRGQKVNKSPVHLISETLNLPVRTPGSLDNNEENNAHSHDHDDSNHSHDKHHHD